MTKKRADDSMTLAVALSFADEPRRVSTLQAPADSMDELYEALRVIAAAYRQFPDSPANYVGAVVAPAPVIGDIVFWHRTIPVEGVSWEKARIVDHSKGCWILDNGDKPNKKTMITAADRQGHRVRYYTYDGMEARNFCEQHARNIGSAVSVCGDPSKLRTIAALIDKDLGA